MAIFNAPQPGPTKAELAERLRSVRLDRFGEYGGPVLAWRLGVPARTWLNYESGVSIPGELLLAFIEVTDVEPRWLLTGLGARYRHRLGDLAGR